MCCQQCGADTVNTLRHFDVRTAICSFRPDIKASSYYVKRIFIVRSASYPSYHNSIPSPLKPPDLCLVKVTKGVKLQDRFYKMPM